MDNLPRVDRFECGIFFSQNYVLTLLQSVHMKQDHPHLIVTASAPSLFTASLLPYYSRNIFETCSYELLRVPGR